MSKTLKVYIALLSIVLFLSVCGKLLIRCFWQEYDCNEYWIVPSFFAGFYFVAFASLFGKSVDARKFITGYLAFKGVKLLTVLFTMLVTAFLFRDEAEVLLVAFPVFYLLMMVPETMYVMYIKKQKV